MENIVSELIASVSSSLATFPVLLRRAIHYGGSGDIVGGDILDAHFNDTVGELDLYSDTGIRDCILSKFNMIIDHLAPNHYCNANRSINPVEKVISLEKKLAEVQDTIANIEHVLLYFKVTVEVSENDKVSTDAIVKQESSGYVVKMIDMPFPFDFYASKKDTKYIDTRNLVIIEYNKECARRTKLKYQISECTNNAIILNNRAYRVYLYSQIRICKIAKHPDGADIFGENISISVEYFSVDRLRKLYNDARMSIESELDMSISIYKTGCIVIDVVDYANNRVEIKMILVPFELWAVWEKM